MEAPIDSLDTMGIGISRKFQFGFAPTPDRISELAWGVFVRDYYPGHVHCFRLRLKT